MAVYTLLTLKSRIANKLSGTIADSDLSVIANDSVLEVVSDIDLRSTKRKSALSPNLFDDIFQYTAPSDLKGRKIIDIMPQVKRGRFDDWRLTTPEEFDRYKTDQRYDQWGDPIRIQGNQWTGESLVAIQEHSIIKKILLSRPVNDTSVTISPLDAVGTWAAFGDGTNLTADSSNYVKESASINWDISAAGGTTAGIYNSSLDSFDIKPYVMEGSVFVWAYITSTTNLTNYILRIGSSSLAYYSITITTTNEGTAFIAGWNLLRFDFANKVATGIVDEDACDYVALYMTKAAAKVSETDYRFDWLVMKKGEHYDVIYYSKFGWQSTTGTWIENSTADTNYVNVDADELKLIEYKYAELCERYLRNSARANEFLKLYEIKTAKYKFDNPSEALPLIMTYWNM